MSAKLAGRGARSIVSADQDKIADDQLMLWKSLVQQGLELAEQLRPLEERVADEGDVVARLAASSGSVVAIGGVAVGRGAVCS